MSDITKDRLAPKWLRDLLRLSTIRSQFVFYGNIRDRFLYPEGDNYRLRSFLDCLWRGLEGKGFEYLVYYDPVEGISIYPDNDETRQSAGDVGFDSNGSFMPADIGKSLLAVVTASVRNEKSRVCVVLDYASRYQSSTLQMDDAHQEFYTALHKLACDARPLFKDGRRVFNPVIWLANQAHDLPAWYARDFDGIHGLEIVLPDYDQRERAAMLLSERLPEYTDQDSETIKASIKTFTDMTEGFSLQNMWDITELARNLNAPIDDIEDTIRGYMAGDPSLENPWSSERLYERVKNAEISVNERVLGQPQATQHAMDILKRSVMGLTGAQSGSSHRRPRGVLFLAGPTGVGKTELAKALTDAIFGNERAMIRFDMSEFNSEHADQRLLGAPPGYVGYETGGELINAVRQKPFSLILFDEIDKAHPRILDKFLQILEDGRITSGQGETVYFSESIIVFTSNKGISMTYDVKTDEGYRKKEAIPLVTPGDSYGKVEKSVKKALHNYFTDELDRPEILNRLGDNIVVFGFIDPETAKAIFDKMIDSIKDRVRDEHDCKLDFTPKVSEKLVQWATEDPSQGGRGIGSRLESMLINPLSRAMFDTDWEPGKDILVTGVEKTEKGTYKVLIE